MTFLKYFVYCITALSLFSCAKESVLLENLNADSPYFSQELIRASLNGRVLDSEDFPISGASVSLVSGSRIVDRLTDEYGRFSFQDIDNLGLSAFISIEAGSKFDAYRRIALVEDQINYTEIKMQSREIIGSYSSNNGGTVTSPDGVEIIFPAGGLVDSNNDNYEGDVDVTLAWIDPRQADFGAQMIGGQVGIEGSGEVKGLRTLGMIQVELFNKTGEEINFASTEFSKVRIPATQSIRSNVPFWSFNEDTGFWEEEVIATYNSGYYEVEVNHFSNWNLCFSYEMIRVYGKINFATSVDTIDIGDLAIEMKSEKYGRIVGRLCKNGAFVFLNAPKGEEVLIEIFGNCGERIFSQKYGPFEEDTDLEEITKPNANDLPIIRGRVWDCEYEPLTEVVVVLETIDQTLRFPVNDQGSFEITIDLCLLDPRNLFVIEDVNTGITLPMVTTITGRNSYDIFICDYPGNYYSENLEHGDEELRKDYCLRFSSFQDSITGKNIVAVEWHHCTTAFFIPLPYLKFTFEEKENEKSYTSDILFYETNFRVEGGEGKMVNPGDLKVTILNHKRGDNDFIMGSLEGQMLRLHDGMSGTDSTMVDYKAVFRAE